MKTILYTKEYAFINAYRVFVTAFSDGSYWAGIVYWDRLGGSVNERDIMLHCQQFSGTTEEEVLRLCQQWTEHRYQTSVDFVELQLA